MLLYDLLLFLHIVAAIIWIGSGFLFQVLATRAERAHDDAQTMALLGAMGALGKTLFVPASFATFVLGLAMVFAGGWSFADLWIIIGLAGFAATFLTGVLVLEPAGKKIGAMVAKDGVTPEALAEGRRLLLVARFDYVVLFLVVAVMALKPTAGDVAVLAAMGAILVLGAAVIFAKLRAMNATMAAAAA